MVNFEEIYDNLDKMMEMKRYKPPTPNYFPSVAEINTYARAEDFEHMIPYLLWLDECLDKEGREQHKEAVDTLRQIVDEIMDKQEVNKENE
jgi:nitrate reductase assembly molybdenum cofactor insertion protein NarJ